MPTRKPHASVILPAYNEQDNIGRCLMSLTQQECSFPYEVIVVDNGSTDETVQIAQQYADRLDLHILREPLKGRGRARRRGWRTARGQILLSTDADTSVPPHWIQTMCDTLEQSDAIGVTGTARIEDCSRFINAIYNICRPVCIVSLRLWLGHYCFGGANFAIRRWVYFAAGEFDTEADAHDDLNLSRRISRFGKTMAIFDQPITVSGRRFRNGILMALGEYVRTYIERFWLKRKWVPLTDVR